MMLLGKTVVGVVARGIDDLRYSCFLFYFILFLGGGKGLVWFKNFRKKDDSWSLKEMADMSVPVSIAPVKN